MMARRMIALLGSLLLFAPLSGCWWWTTEQAEGEKFVLGDLVDQDFKAPKLDELEQQVEETGGWVDRPVLNSVDLLREKQAKELEEWKASGKPVPTVEEALALKNNSDDANEKLLFAMGRLPEGNDDVDYEAIFTRHSLQALNNVNPLLASASIEQEVGSLMNFGLFTFDWDFNPFASSDTVESWQSSKDGLYDKVVLRDDLYWSDGEPVTAHDVEFTYLVIMSDKVPIPAIRQGTDQLKYVKAYDDQTLVYFHKQALATNEWNLNFPIIPKHVYEKSIFDDPKLTDSDYHAKLEKEPVVGGPYRIVKRSDTELVLDRREDYYKPDGKQVRSKLPFKSVRFRIRPDSSTALIALKSGNIDEMMLEAPQWESQTTGDDFYAKNTKVRDTEWVTFSFQWNNKSPYFQDRRVRWALTYAFDHGEMLSTLRYGRDEACTGTFHPESKWFPGQEDTVVKFSPQPVKQDREEAKRLLDAAGWKDTDGDGWRDKMIGGRKQKFEFSIVVRNQKERVDICELLAQNLKLLGIDCNVRSLEGATLQDKTFNKEFDAAFGGWGTGADPYTSLNIWGSKESRNFVSYNSPEVDELFRQGELLDQDRKPWKELKLWKNDELRKYLQIDESVAGERPSRHDCYAAIHTILWYDQPYTWLFFRNAYYAFNKKIRGYNFSPRGPYSYSPGFESLWQPAAL